jgi:hypothetical protein
VVFPHEKSDKFVGQEESISRQGTPRREAIEIKDDPPSKRKVDFKSRVALRRIRANIPDQGIKFDKDRHPCEKDKQLSRDVN